MANTTGSTYRLMEIGNGVKSAGYSGTPLAKKLGIKSGFCIKLVNPPSYYSNLFIDLPLDLRFESDVNIKKDIIHFFTKQIEEYLTTLPALKKEIKPDGMIWVSWPKRSSRMLTDVTEDLIRNYAIEIGLVDIKVCAVNEIWSGLKLVIPVKDRDRF